MPSSTSPAIAVDRLVKRYRTATAVDGISFALPRGSITGLLGGNGAGKTTTIAMIMGLVTPTSGTVGVLGAKMPDQRYDVLNRMNFAMGLAAGRIPGLVIDLDRVVPPTENHEVLIEAIDRTVLGGRMSDNTRKVIRREIADLKEPAAARAMAIGLALGGPEFQRQ